MQVLVLCSVLVGALGFLAAPARAEILPCDKREKGDYEIVGYSKKHRQLAVRRSWVACVLPEGRDSGGENFEFETIEVYTQAGKLKRKFFWSGEEKVRKLLSGKAALPKELGPMLEGALPREKIEHYLDVGKFGKLEPSAASPSGECKVVVRQGPEIEEGVVPERKTEVLLDAGGEKERLASFQTSAREVKAAVFWYRKPRLAILLSKLRVWHPGSGHCCDEHGLAFHKVPAKCF
jgi:hypothetical protein